jgi:hypothetical protein
MTKENLTHATEINKQIPGSVPCSSTLLFLLYTESFSACFLPKNITDKKYPTNPVSNIPPFSEINPSEYESTDYLRLEQMPRETFHLDISRLIISILITFAVWFHHNSQKYSESQPQIQNPTMLVKK